MYIHVHTVLTLEFILKSTLLYISLSLIERAQNLVLILFLLYIFSNFYELSTIKNYVYVQIKYKQPFNQTEKVLVNISQTKSVLFV